MALCSYVEKRRNRYYFRIRLPAEIVAVAGRTHVAASRGTGDPRVAKNQFGANIFSLASIVETMCLKMARAFDIDGTDLDRAEALAMGAFVLGQEYEVKKAQLCQEFAIKLQTCDSRLTALHSHS